MLLGAVCEFDKRQSAGEFVDMERNNVGIIVNPLGVNEGIEFGNPFKDALAGFGGCFADLFHVSRNWI